MQTGSNSITSSVSDGVIAGAEILSILALMSSSRVAIWVGIDNGNSTTLF